MNNLALEKITIDQPSPPLFDLVNKRKPSEIVAMRGSELPGIVALPIRALFPELPTPIWTSDPSLGNTDLDAVRERTLESISKVDWSKIQRGDTVNLLANPHGFFIAGEAYATMLEVIQKYVHDKTGGRVRLRIAESMGHIENPDWMKIYDLPARFGKGTKEVPQISRGEMIDTKLGRFGVMHELFNAKHFIHTLVTEMREGYIHRMLDRLYKPFGMAYTRIETRSAYHFSFGPRTGQMVSRAVFDSDYIQQRYVSTVALELSGEGVIGVDSDNDLGALDRRTAVQTLTNYGPLLRIFSEIKDCITVLDGHGSSVYTYAAGTAWDNLFSANKDYLDLDMLAIISKGGAQTPGIDPDLTLGHNPAIKAVVINYQALGVPAGTLFDAYPVYLVGDEFARWVKNDPSMCYLHQRTEKIKTLPEAVELAKQKHGTENVLIYDGSPGIFRVSRSLAEHLIKVAPKVREDVINNKLPKWLAQRGLS